MCSSWFAERYIWSEMGQLFEEYDFKIEIVPIIIIPEAETG